MVDSYIGEIRMFSGSYAPQGWALCDGSTLQITQFEALYSLIGTVYGGDGRTNFRLPDLRGRVPIHFNGTYPIGLNSGTETVTLTQAELPAHTHLIQASGDIGDGASPENGLWAKTTGYSNYVENEILVPMGNQAISTVGGNQSHNNMMPSLTISFIISLQGIYPTQY